MTDLAIIPVAGTLDDYSDPAAFVELALTHSKQWLTSAIDHGDIGSIIELKSQAEAIRVYTAQKNLGKEVELNAAEIVRRAQRGLELAIQREQEAGRVLARGQHKNINANQWGRSAVASDPSNCKPSPTEFFDDAGERADARIMAIASDQQFEEALADAREEANLSRANVVRKIKGDVVDDKIKVAKKLASRGNSTDQIAQQLGYSRPGMVKFLERHSIDVPADEIVERRRKLDSARIVTSTIDTIDGIGSLFDQIDYAGLPAEKVQGWLEILNESIRSLTTLRNRLKETSQP